jgi:5-formyltetrahydrofolate cyclo-ligase
MVTCGGRRPRQAHAVAHNRDMTDATVPSAKGAVRRAVRASRRASTATRNRAADAAAIAAHVLAGCEEALSGGRPVAIYRSLPTEPPTEALAEALHARAVPVLVPLLLDDRDLDWCLLLPDGSTGPALGCEAVAAAALVITPALAVDASGVRLGQGGGSYDRALRRRDPGALVVAVVGDDELVPGPLPGEDHDVRVDAVVTPGRGMVRLPAAAAGST